MIVEDRKNWGALISVAASGIKDMTDKVFMPIFAFLLLAGYESTGFFFSITGLVTMGIYWVVGWIYDSYSKEKLLKVGVLLNFFVWWGRSLTFSTVALYLVESVKRIANPMLSITHDGLVYQWGKTEPLKYMMVRSLVWQLAAVGWLFFLMVGFWFGVGLRIVFAATAIVVLGHTLILRPKQRSYMKQSFL